MPHKTNNNSKINPQQQVPKQVTEPANTSSKKLLILAVFVGFIAFAALKFPWNNKQEEAVQNKTAPPKERQPADSPPPPPPPSKSDSDNSLGGAQSSFGISEPIFDVPFQPDGLGQNGAEVELPDDLKAKAAELFKIHQFNLIASDLIGINRTLPDYRFEECLKKTYPTDLPDTSIVIVFHNEAWSTMMRTLVSIIDRTPSHLLHEIILIDDGSTFNHLFEKLETAVEKLPAKIVIDRMPVRSGLVKARLRGASLATGAVITFLDSHIECTTGWLEPLLAEVKRNRRVAAFPLIDVVHDENFAYLTVHDGTAAGFNWKMMFDWKYLTAEEQAIREKDRSVPLPSPVMAGGLYAIDREFFFEIGAYDPGFIVWGGENLEMSFRMWMCGGEILIVTCSRVGHVFRKVTPYEWPGGVSHVLAVNALRTAHVWLDDHKDWVIKNMPNAGRVQYGDVGERIALRKKLGCKSFQWYLENIYPESPLPPQFYSLGYVRSFDGVHCLDTAGFTSKVFADLIPCHYEGGNQFFSLTSNDQLMGNERMCLAALETRVGYAPCELPENVFDEQRWRYNPETKQLVHLFSNLCMDVPEGVTVVLSTCSNAATQKWEVEGYRPLPNLHQTPQ